MASVALVTCRELPGGDEDAAVLAAALADAGVAARWQVWDDAAVDWSACDLAVVRSTWDYTLRREEFLAWANAVPRLANPAAVIAWNSDKRYLRELADAGIAVVATTWVAPGEALELPRSGDFVLKPSVGAGSRGAGRFRADDHDAAREHARHLHERGRTVLVEPYLAGVDTDGETSLIYLDGVFSHAVRKAAMLPAGAVHDLGGGRAHALFEPERISAAEASAAEREVGEHVAAELVRRFGAALLYARVDLLPSDDGPVVVELEVAEPSLFLGYADGGAQRFAAAIASRL